MSKRALLIAEKPSLMREIKEVYDNHRDVITDDITFMAQAGHIISLKLPKEIDEEKYGKWTLSDFPEIYPYQYKINEGKERLVQDIDEALQEPYDYIIHAGDPDGEGELLVKETLLFLHNTKPVLRFWSNDLTEGAILNALQNLRSDDEYTPIYDAALTRQKIDYQFGMNMTACGTLKMGDLCKLGRVKAAIIALIVKRELELEQYVEKHTFKPSFLYNKLEFVYDKAYDTKELALAENPKTDTATVTSVNTKTNRKKAPKLFKLSTLQSAAYKAFGWSGKETLATLQKLYEAKVVSYPRTDCEYISSKVDIGSIAKSVLRERVFECDMSLLTKDPTDVCNDKTYCNDKAILEEGHTAIIPTGNGFDSTLTDKEFQLYSLICRHFIAIFAEDKQSKTTKVVAVPNGSDNPYVYTETEDLNCGYELILNPNYKKRQASGISFSNAMPLTPIELSAKECISKPPQRYNDGSLIDALDKPEDYKDDSGKKVKYRIGTPATRSNIIEECISNGYFTKKKGKFYAETKAKAVIQTFGQVELFNPTESGLWESMLDDIRTQTVTADDILKTLIEKMKISVHMMKEVEGRKLSRPGAEVIGKCPKCQSDVVVGKFGPYCKEKCGLSLGRAFGKVLTTREVKSILAGKQTLVKGLTSKKTGKTYDALLTMKPGFATFTGKDGETKYSLQFDTEFPKK